MQPGRALLCAIAVAGLAYAPSLTARQATQQTAASGPATSGELDALLREADVLLRGKKPREAKLVFERALEAARRLSLGGQEGTALCGIAASHSEITQYREARQVALQCLDVFERLSVSRGIGWANLILAGAADVSGDYPEAKTRAERSVDAYEAANDARGRALATLQLLRVGGGLGRDFELLSRVVDDATAAGDRGVTAGALHSWGDGLFSTGQYDEALDKLERAAALYQEIDNRAALGTVYNSIGRLYRAHGRLDDALQWQLKALALHQTLGRSYEHMQSLNAVATVHQFMGDLPKAREYFERALALAEESSSARIQNFLRANIANLNIGLGQFERAAATLEQVIAAGTDAYPSLRYGQLSLAQLRMGRHQDALASAQQSVRLCSNPSDCVLALQRRTEVNTALGEDSKALADIDAALTTLEGMRAKLVPADFFKQEFHRRQEDVYSQAIALKLRERHDGDALETAELARSRAFLDLLASRDVRFKDQDQSRIAAWRADPNAIGATSPPTSGLPLVLRGTETRSPSETAAMLELRSFVTATPASTGEIAAIAARLHSTFVSYWVADDAVHVWVIGPEGRTHTRTVNVLRSKLVDLIRSTGQTTGQKADAGPWREMYNLLIGPVRQALPSTPGALVTIVPHGPLLNLSFAALQDARGRYLLEDYTLHYVPAGAVLQFTAGKRRSDARASDLLLVADPVLPPGSRLDRPLPRLPGARSEAGAIARLVPRDRVTMLADKAAAESAVRSAAGGKAVLHFATHAVVRDDDPFGSFLALAAAAGSGPAGDGLLTAQEIYGLDLRADLVVLSACRSGGGRVTGDGVATFARAFIYAGTASLVASLWDVADEPTNRLLPAFYRAWFGGQSKARALRTAQLQLLRDLRAGQVMLDTPAGRVSLPQHPVFWAGFALIGEPE